MPEPMQIGGARDAHTHVFVAVHKPGRNAAFLMMVRNGSAEAAERIARSNLCLLPRRGAGWRLDRIEGAALETPAGLFERGQVCRAHTLTQLVGLVAGLRAEADSL
jgi:hypothetical protein